MPNSTASATTPAHTIDGALLADFIKQAEQEAEKIVRENTVVQNLHLNGRPNNSPRADVAKTLQSVALLTGADASCLMRSDDSPFFGEHIKELVSAVKNVLR